jgi:hypothetical protein
MFDGLPRVVAIRTIRRRERVFYDGIGVVNGRIGHIKTSVRGRFYLPNKTVAIV